MREKGIVIAIDGPAGAGKSSVGAMFAEKIGYDFLSTGQMYRALAWKALKLGLDLESENKMRGLASLSDWKFSSESGILKVVLDNETMDERLDGEEVGKATSSIARLPMVRDFMRDKQRETGAAGGVVMEGRDIGSNVFPDAEIKIYLDASPEERARRRTRQLASQNKRADYGEILAAIKKRDRQDAERKYNPLMKGKDYRVIDTTGLEQRAVVEKMEEIYNDYTGSIK